MTPCLQSHCPNAAVSRGRCVVHKRTEAQRGYGADWRATRAAVRAEVRACEECGIAIDLTVDHIVPQSMGGTNERDNLRVLCRSCHGRVGVRGTGAGQISAAGLRLDTRAPVNARLSVSELSPRPFFRRPRREP